VTLPVDVVWRFPQNEREQTRDGCLKIVVVGGAARSLVNFRGPLLEAMVSRGHEVIACAPDAPENVREKLAYMGVEYCHVPVKRAGMNPAGDLMTAFHLFCLFRRRRPDAVLGYTAKPVIWGCLAARAAGVPAAYAMITGLGYAFIGGGGFRQQAVGRVAAVLYRAALARTRAVFFQNPDDLADFKKRNLLKNDARTVLINGSGVDLGHYPLSPLPDAPVFLLMARLIGDKGIREYREAARRVRAKYPQARFLLAGGFDENPAAISKEEIRRWQEEGDIEYLGRLEDVRPAIAQSRIYVLPSFYREGIPRTVLEAMSMGRPVITTDAPGCRETIEFVNGKWEVGSRREAKDESKTAEAQDPKAFCGMIKAGKNGFLVPVKDAGALAEAMEKFIEQPELAGRMGKESRRIAEEKYDVHKVNRVILDTMGL
jgi:glycosyltransferase involved in cell wall biosynthesis